MPTQISEQTIADADKKHYDDWFNTSVIYSKASGLSRCLRAGSVGNISSETSRQLASRWLEGYVE
jgi:hypothetical protein